MSTFAHQVIAFNQAVLKIDPRPVSLLPQNEFEITMKSLQEEIDEFEEAFKSGDIIKCVDALIDLQYFAIGALYKMGLTAQTINTCCTHVHEANMQKKLGVVEKRAVDGTADAVKPADWLPPEHRIADTIDAQMEATE